MAKKTTFSVDDAQQEVVSAFEKFIAVLANSAGSSKPVKSAQVDEDDDEDDDEEVEPLTQEQVDTATEEGVVALRALAAAHGIDKKKKGEILEAFAEIVGDEDEDEDEEDEDEDAWDEDSLGELDLKELRKVAKSDFEIPAADLKGLDQDEIIALCLGDEDDEDEDDEEDEDEDEDDDDEEDEDDDDEEVIDEDALNEMSNKQLLSLAKDDLEIKVPKKIRDLKGAKQKKELVALILESGDDE